MREQKNPNRNDRSEIIKTAFAKGIIREEFGYLPNERPSGTKGRRPKNDEHAGYIAKVAKLLEQRMREAGLAPLYQVEHPRFVVMRVIRKMRADAYAFETVGDAIRRLYRSR